LPKTACRSRRRRAARFSLDLKDAEAQVDMMFLQSARHRDAANT
jgi:hypothetical protein